MRTNSAEGRERARRMLHLRRTTALTLREIGQLFALSRERTRQLIARERMREKAP